MVLYQYGMFAGSPSPAFFSLSETILLEILRSYCPPTHTSHFTFSPRPYIFRSPHTLCLPYPLTFPTYMLIRHLFFIHLLPAVSLLQFCCTSPLFVLSNYAYSLPSFSEFVYIINHPSTLVQYSLRPPFNPA